MHTYLATTEFIAGCAVGVLACFLIFTVLAILGKRESDAVACENRAFRESATKYNIATLALLEERNRIGMKQIEAMEKIEKAITDLPI